MNYILSSIFVYFMFSYQCVEARRNEKQNEVLDTCLWTMQSPSVSVGLVFIFISND